MLAMQANRAKARDLGQNIVPTIPSMIVNNPAPLDTENIPFFRGFYVEEVVEDVYINSRTRDQGWLKLFEGWFRCKYDHIAWYTFPRSTILSWQQIIFNENYRMLPRCKCSSS